MTETKTKILVTCAGMPNGKKCDIEVERWPSQVEKNSTGRFFCSASCRATIGSKPRTVPDAVCEMCGVTFRKTQAKQTGRFCSKECHNVWQGRDSVVIPCEVCGVKMTLKPSQYERGIRRCSKKCQGAAQVKRGTGEWHNGKEKRAEPHGYVYVWEPNHPNAYQSGWILEHRLVASQKEGRALLPSEQVHHINGIKDDNRPENLAILAADDHTKTTVAEGSMRRAAAAARIRELEERLALYEPIEDKL